MKIVLIDGQDHEKARSRFAQIINSSKSKNWEVVQIKEGSTQTLAEQLRQNSLFSDQMIFYIDPLNKFEISQLDWIISNTKTNANLLLFNKGPVSNSYLKKLPKNIKRENFKIPVKIFKFLESAYPGNAKTALNLLNDIDDMPPEAVFALLARHTRDLYWVKKGGTGLNYQDWRKNKLAKQAEKFDEYELKIFINSLLKIDIQNKTSPLDMKTLLDLTLARELK